MRCAIPLAFASIVTPAAGAQSPQPLFPAPPTDFGLYGQSVAVHDGLIVVGEPQSSLAGPQTGRAYVYVQDPGGHWVEIEAFSALEDSVMDTFGTKVRANGDRVVIGLPGFDEGRGDVWVYRRNPDGTLEFEDALNDETPALRFIFGKDIAIDGERLAATSLHGTPVFGSGVAYMFDRDAGGEWIETAQVVSPNPTEFDAFGLCAALVGDWLFLGAPGDDTLAEEAGAAYVFRRNAQGEWTLHQSLAAPVVQPGARFGSALAADGDTLAVGAHRELHGGVDGAVHAFRRDAADRWQFDATLIPAALDADDIVGEAVAVSGARVCMGAPLSDIATEGGGAVFLFERDEHGQWSESAPLTAPSLGDGSEVGYSVAIDGDTVVAGALFAHLGDIRPGAVAVFNLGPCPADLDASGAVDGADLSALLGMWGPSPAPADLNGDGAVTGADLALLLADWGDCD